MTKPLIDPAVAGSIEQIGAGMQFLHAVPFFAFDRVVRSKPGDRVVMRSKVLGLDLSRSLRQDRFTFPR